MCAVLFCTFREVTSATFILPSSLSKEGDVWFFFQALTFFSHCETICPGQCEYVYVVACACVCVVDIGVR